MKKTLAIVLSLFMTFSLAACGGAETERSAEERENNISESKAGAVAKEILEATVDSGKIQIYGEVIQLPICLNDLVTLGFEYKTDKASLDYLYAEKESAVVQLYYGDVNVTAFSCENNLEGSHTLEEINPSITCLDMINVLLDEELAENIYFPGGIRAGDSCKVIEEQLGLSSSSGETYIYGEYQKGAGLMFSCDPNGGTILYGSVWRVDAE